MFPDPVALVEILGVVVLALGGREGIAHIKNKRNGSNGNGYVQEKFCDERTGNLKEILHSVQEDVKEIKEILQNPHT
jgi:hypothetical protein